VEKRRLYKERTCREDVNEMGKVNQSTMLRKRKTMQKTRADERIVKFRSQAQIIPTGEFLRIFTAYTNYRNGEASPVSSFRW
jgi:hypothetical protein